MFNKTLKGYGIYNVVIGIIFTVFFGGIALYASTTFGHVGNGIQIVNGILLLIIGVLGLIDGIRTIYKGYKILSQ